MANIKAIKISNTDYPITGRPFYGTCSSAATATTKVVTCTEFKAADLTAGVVIAVKNTTKNTAAVADLMLNVNSTGDCPVRKIMGGTLSNLSVADEIGADAVLLFLYDGTNWVLINTDYNTNSDVKVQQVVSTTNNFYPVLTRNVTTTTSATNNVYFDSKVFINHSTGQVISNGAVSNSGGSSVGGFQVQEGGTAVAAAYAGIAGTTDTVGEGRIVAGNSTASGTAHNARGRITVYGTGAYGNIIYSNAASSNKDNTIPNVTGFLATGATAGVGSAATPVYMDSTGELKACTSWDTNTDTKVTQARGTLNNSYPILTAPTSTFGTTTTTQNTAVYHNNVFINASLGRITSNGTINAACSSAGGFNLQGAGVQYGGFYVGAQGTTTAVGNAILLAGNNTASGTAGNAQGLLRMYDSGAYYTTLKGSSASSNKEITFPNITGTVIVDAGAQTLSGAKTFGATITLNNKILGKYTTTVNTTTSVQANNIMNAVPTAAGTDNQIVFVTVD